MIEQKPDWSEVIFAIKRKTRWTDKEIGRRVGCAGAALTNIKNMRFGDVRFSIGAAILNLYEKTMKNGESNHRQL